MPARIALDAMGGEQAPDVPVRGALAALRDPGADFEIILVGDEARIRPLLTNARPPAGRLTVRHASQVIDMNESPVTALRKNPDSSIGVGTALQKSGEADAFVSTGSTGAVMAAALTTLGRIHRIQRPAIVTIWPTAKLPCVVLDVGANVDSKPAHLFQFALMGHHYARDVLGRDRPRVALLSIGEEPSKGNEATVAAHDLLAGSGLEFVGNVEGGDVLRGRADVVVCDGFVGNILLKFGESLVDFLARAVRDEVAGSPRARIGALLMKPAFRALQRRIDYAEIGGAPLLGVNGVVIIGHGGSSVKAVANAVRVAATAVERRMVRHIEEAVGASDDAPTRETRSA